MSIPFKAGLASIVTVLALVFLSNWLHRPFQSEKTEWNVQPVAFLPADLEDKTEQSLSMPQPLTLPNSTKNQDSLLVLPKSFEEVVDSPLPLSSTLPSLQPTLNEIPLPPIEGFARVRKSSLTQQLPDKVFGLDELDQPPRLLNRPRATFPEGLIRRGIAKGRVVLIVKIDKEGRAELEEIIESSDPELAQAAAAVVKQARFSSPLHKGKSVETRFRWPLVLQR